MLRPVAPVSPSPRLAVALVEALADDPAGRLSEAAARRLREVALAEVLGSDDPDAAWAGVLVVIGAALKLPMDGRARDALEQLAEAGHQTPAGPPPGADPAADVRAALARALGTAGHLDLVAVRRAGGRRVFDLEGIDALGLLRVSVVLAEVDGRPALADVEIRHRPALLDVGLAEGLAAALTDLGVAPPAGGEPAIVGLLPVEAAEPRIHLLLRTLDGTAAHTLVLRAAGPVLGPLEAEPAEIAELALPALLRAALAHAAAAGPAAELAVYLRAHALAAAGPVAVEGPAGTLRLDLPVLPEGGVARWSLDRRSGCWRVSVDTANPPSGQPR